MSGRNTRISEHAHSTLRRPGEVNSGIAARHDAASFDRDDAAAAAGTYNGGMSLDLALAVFRHIEGADHAYADVLDSVGDVPWVHEIALVEHHRRDRLVVRGTFAGHYVDVDDQRDPIGKKTAEGALTGALAGALFGPPGLAVGLVGGGIAGGVAQAGVPELHDALFDEVRADVPQGSSAVTLLAAPAHVDAMVAAFEGRGGQVIRRHLSTEAARALEAAVAGRPLAAG
jgi:uncharacterized membrane protein